MVVCPNCNHSNPDGAVQCEACYTPLPAMINCPNCGASAQADANFCGQCGFNLQKGAVASGAHSEAEVALATAPPQPNLPDPVQLDPLVTPEPLVAVSLPDGDNLSELPDVASAEEPLPPPPVPPVVASPEINSGAMPESGPKTQLQQQSAHLFHVQTNTSLELPNNLAVIHLGKQNDRIPPDIDLSGFPDAEIVSRIHADIRLEGDAYFIEDVGSSNGTYINNTPLPMGNRHRLRSGDRIALGKGDRVTFLFQIS